MTSTADNATYYYMEGMNATMGSYGGYGHGVRAVMIADRGLREGEPGVYAGTTRLPEAGRYQVGFLLESPRLVHCFEFEALPNPLLKKAGPPIHAEYPDLPLRVGPGDHAIQVRLQDPGSREPLTGLEDVRLSFFLAPGEARTEASIYPKLTLYESVLMALLVHRKVSLDFFSPAMRFFKDDVSRILEDVGLADQAHRQGDSISHGDKKRLKLAVTVNRTGDSSSR